MSGDLLQRARLLRDRKRFEDAIAMLHGYFGGVDYRQGLRGIRRALSSQSALLHALGRFQDALLAANTAKRLNPEMAYASVKGPEGPERTVWVISAMLIVIVNPGVSMMPVLRRKKTN